MGTLIVAGIVNRAIKVGSLTMKGFILSLFVTAAYGDFTSLARSGHNPRTGRQDASAVPNGIDFTGCTPDPDTGLCCVDKEETVTTLEKEPILECTHKNTKQCHYTYVTQFQPSQEEVCEENFEKTCSITFKQQAFNETVKKCYRPLEKVCNGQGPEECRTVYESSCTTKYVEKQPGKFVGETGCEKLPVEICGAGCTFEEGPEECHDKVIASLVDVPEEVCDLNPQKTCRFITKLVPKLSPEHECTIVPKETCILKFISHSRWTNHSLPSGVLTQPLLLLETVMMRKRPLLPQLVLLSQLLNQLLRNSQLINQLLSQILDTSALDQETSEEADSLTVSDRHLLQPTAEVEDSLLVLLSKQTVT